MPSRFTENNIGGERKTISVCDNKRVEYNLLCLYAAAYPTKENIGAGITHYQPNNSLILTFEGSKVR